MIVMTINDSALARELQHPRPFTSQAEEALVGLMRTADVLRRAMGTVLEGEDITIQQYNVLRILRGVGERGLPTLEIAERMVEHAPGITRMIDRLIAKGLVVRERCAEDRRIVYGAITDLGRGPVDRLDEPMMRACHLALDPLNEREQRALIGMLDELRAGHAPLCGEEVFP